MRFNLVTTWITLASIFVGTCIGYILYALPSWTQEHEMLECLEGYVGWLTFYGAVGGLLLGLCLLGFGIRYLHKCESKSKQDIKYEPNKPQKPYESPNDKAMVKEGFGLVGVASVLALLALVAFIFNRA